MQHMFDEARRQFRMLMPAMGCGGRFHLYRLDGTDHLSVLHEERVKLDGALKPVVRDVQGLSEAEMLNRLQDHVRGLVHA